MAAFDTRLAPWLPDEMLLFAVWLFEATNFARFFNSFWFAFVSDTLCVLFAPKSATFHKTSSTKAATETHNAYVNRLEVGHS